MVKDSKRITQIKIDGSTIPDILELIKHGERVGADFITDSFTKSITGRTDKETFKNLWSVLRNRIKYKADGSHQIIQSPGALWKGKIGDCKSFALFVASTLQKMNIPYSFVLDRYNPDTPNQAHIYVVSNGIVIDPVNPVFNSSDTAWKREFYPGVRSISEINGIPEKSGLKLIGALLLLTIILKK